MISHVNWYVIIKLNSGCCFHATTRFMVHPQATVGNIDQKWLGALLIFFYNI
jgi:hypothetical protein